MTYREKCSGCGFTFRSKGDVPSHGRYAKNCTPYARFWGKVDKSAGRTACWPYTGSITTHGYGSAAWNRHTLGAHKVAWLTLRGPVPDGLCVLHRCDNPPCCNPRHLFLGTKQDNADDKSAKGRGQKRNPRKLDPKKAREIRALKGKATSGEIAALYNIDQSHAFAIWAGRVWKNA